MVCSYPHNGIIILFCQNFAFLLGLPPSRSAYQPPQYIFSGYALSGYRSFRKSLHSVVPCFPLAFPLPYRASLLTLGNIQEILTLLSLTRSLIISLACPLLCKRACSRSKMKIHFTFYSLNRSLINNLPEIRPSESKTV